VLKLRFISALVLVPLVVIAVLKLDVHGFAVLVACAVALAAWEWGGLVPHEGGAGRAVFMAVTLAVLALVWPFADREILVNGVLWAAMAWWLFALFWITRPVLGNQQRLAKDLLGIVLLVTMWLSLVVLHGHPHPEKSKHWVLFLLVLIWVADSGAYFAGKQWGRTKLAPAVSPGKTWEGVLGALTVCALFAFGYARFIDYPAAATASFVLVCLVTVLFSIAGDLLISLLKRQRGLKDSGNLIPGHGGILDRLDSLIAASPVFLFGMRWVEL
jgi:phosphatidate cytidylyltransferase